MHTAMSCVCVCCVDYEIVAMWICHELNVIHMWIVFLLLTNGSTVGIY